MFSAIHGGRVIDPSQVQGKKTTNEGRECFVLSESLLFWPRTQSWKPSQSSPPHGPAMLYNFRTKVYSDAWNSRESLSTEIAQGRTPKRNAKPIKASAHSSGV